MLGKDHTLALRNPAVHDETKVDDEEVPLELTAIVSKELTKDFPPWFFSESDSFDNEILQEIET